MVSMTGFGRAERRGRLGTVTVEMRSVNHRYLEVSCRIKEGWAGLEDAVRALVQEQVRRGKVTVTVTVHGAGAISTTINTAAARQHLEALRRLQRDLKLEGAVTLDWLVALPGVVASMDEAVGTWRPLVMQATRGARAALVRTRQREGQALGRAVGGIVRHLEQAAAALAARAPQVVDEYRVRLEARIQALTTHPLEPGRLEHEIALFAKECDITEERTRIAAHIAHTKRLLAGGASVGRTMDFVAQELQREVNTVGSKANDVAVSQLAIQMKGWVEQLREQAQNIE